MEAEKKILEILKEMRTYSNVSAQISNKILLELIQIRRLLEKNGEHSGD